MKNLTLLTATLIALIWNSTKLNGQSPIVSLPPFYYDAVVEAQFPLPQPALSNPALFDDFIETGNLVDATGATVFGYDGRPAKACHNAIYGENGELVAFIIDEYIFDREGYLLDVFEDQGGNVGLQENEFSIIPDPSNCNRFYIVGIQYNERSYDMSSLGYESAYIYYSVLDLTKDRSDYLYNETRIGGLEEAQNGRKIFDLFPRRISPQWPDYPVAIDNVSGRAGAFSFAVTPINDNNERFLFVSRSGQLHRFLIDANGITWDNNQPDYYVSSPNTGTGAGLSLLDFRDVLPQTGTIGVENVDRLHRQELEVIQLVNGNYRVGRNLTVSVNNSLKLTYTVTVDFDNNGILIPGSENYYEIRNSNAPTTYDPNDDLYLTGLEFSEDGNYIYVTTTINSDYPNEPAIRYIDVANVTVNHLTVPNEQDFRSGFIELAANGKLYFAADGKLGSLDDPNNPSSPFVPNAVILPGYVYANGYEPNNTSDFKIAYVLPDQIDGEDWLAIKDDIYPCCDRVSGGYSGGFTALTGTHTWEPGDNPFNNAVGDVYMNGNLTIPSGANIVIKNMTFRFEELAQVNVEPGGRLRIYGTTLTSRSCEGLMWQGVRVIGSGNGVAPIPIANHGYFTMYQSSEISNAYIGVTNHYAEGDQNDPALQIPNYGATGGLISVSNSTFLNNIKDVDLNTYNHPNRKYYFTNCDFLTTAQILDGSNPTWHAEIVNSSNTYFKGCDFANTTTGVYGDTERGGGINSIDTQFEVTYRCNGPVIIGGPCNNKDRGAFNGLHRGVYATASSSSTPATIKYCDFSDVSMGVYLQNTDLSYCVNNNFNDIGPLVPMPLINLTLANGAYGLYLDHTTGYSVENNEFNTQLSNHTFGTIVVNSNAGHNPDVTTVTDRIYNNRYVNLDYGIAGLLNNVDIGTDGSVDQASGLRIICNDFEGSNKNDVAWDLGGISSIQATNGFQNGAGNTFSTSPSPAGSQFMNYNVWQADPNIQGHLFFTQYFYDAINNGPAGSVIQPTINSAPNNYNTKTTQTSSTFNPATSCPVNRFDLSKKSLLGGKKSLAESRLFDGEAIESTYAYTDLEAKDLIDQYKNGQISSGNYKNQMMVLAPYLNDERLIDQLDNTLNLPHGIVKNIMESSAPLSKKVIDEVDQASLPKGIKNQIFSLEAANNELPLNVREKYKSIGYVIESKLLVTELIKEYLTDTTIVGGEDSAYALMKQYGRFYKKCDETSFLIGRGKYSEAQDIIDELKIASALHQDFCKFNELLIELNTAAEGCYAIKNDTALKAEVEAIAYKPEQDKTCLRAYRILQEVYKLSFNEKLPYYGLPKSSNGILATQDESDYVSTSLISIYPNPSSGIVNIFIDDEMNSTGSIMVYDNLGKMIVNTTFANSLGYVDLSSFEKGLYMVVVTTESGETYFDRVILE
ncbi:T9SS type A sorting domain-containing protein [Parvicella tangerina]|uniref:Secretion system C-terminal sorting domain-containing protein n=1 Tax=Parvicella tangerina TaxID=2829795 RepID=A0A916JQ17_9FLAO|nr:T9SS type A sorting domain-containing protein [Parvicella tangerina]CAG5086568.1 hypothetical protein CRYO30217_03180 [Parvicella tangerina]